MLTDVQFAIIAIVGSAIVWAFKLAKQDLSAGWATTLVYVVSLVLAWFFAPVAVPAPPICGDPAGCVPLYLAWLGDLVVVLSAFAGFATLVYNALLKSVLDRFLLPIVKKK